MSWEFGFLAASLLGLAVGWLASWVSSMSLRLVLLGAMPLVCVCALYWLPTSAKGSASEYANWAPIFVFPWAMAAYAGAMSGSLAFRWYSSRSRSR